MIRCPTCNDWTPGINGMCSKCYGEAMEGLPQTPADRAALQTVANEEGDVLRLAEDLFGGPPLPEAEPE